MRNQKTLLTNASNHAQLLHTNQAHESLPNSPPERQIEALPRSSVNMASNCMTAVEFEHLHARLITLESVLIGLLADASAHQLALVREIAVQMLPQPGFTQHASTRMAADQITQLVERANHFRGVLDA